MIKLTRINGGEIFINEVNIQWIEVSPDTTITFLNGVKIIVKENLDHVLHLLGTNSKETSQDFEA